MDISTSIEQALPDPFLREHEARVATAVQWKLHRKKLQAVIVDLAYGGLPPVPENTQCELLHWAPPDPAVMRGTRFASYRIHAGKIAFILYLHVPAGAGPFPVVLSGDGCWRYATDKVIAEILRRDKIFAHFNRVEIAPDIYRSERTSGLYTVWPDASFGALAAWAWGYHRCLDALCGMPLVDAVRIAVAGHSRGGKAALLAGATDERIALTWANNSGAGGAGCYRWLGPGSEKLADSMRLAPYWYGPRLREYVERVAELPFDQHFLKALIAPRVLLTTEALDDAWANPTGTWQTHRAAMEVYRFLGVPRRIGIRFRPGVHGQGAADWQAFLDFMDWHFHGSVPGDRYDLNPYPNLPPAFAWSAP